MLSITALTVLVVTEDEDPPDPSERIPTALLEMLTENAGGGGGGGGGGAAVEPRSARRDERGHIYADFVSRAHALSAA